MSTREDLDKLSERIMRMDPGISGLLLMTKMGISHGFDAPVPKHVVDVLMGGNVPPDISLQIPTTLGLCLVFAGTAMASIQETVKKQSAMIAALREEIAQIKEAKS